MSLFLMGTRNIQKCKYRGFVTYLEHATPYSCTAQTNFESMNQQSPSSQQKNELAFNNWHANFHFKQTLERGQGPKQQTKYLRTEKAINLHHTQVNTTLAALSQKAVFVHQPWDFHKRKVGVTYI